MSLYYIKCSLFTKNRNIKIKCETDRKIILYSSCIDCNFKKFETIDEGELSYLVKGLK